jgi:hypothetical protein
MMLVMFDLLDGRKNSEQVGHDSLERRYDSEESASVLTQRKAYRNRDG